MDSRRRTILFLTGAGMVLAMAQPALAVVPVLVPAAGAVLSLIPVILLALGGMFLALFKLSTLKKIPLVLWRQKIPLVVIAGMITGGVYLWGIVFPTKVMATNAAVQTNVFWPMFRGDAGRTGYAGNGADPVTGGINWSMNRDVRGKDARLWSSPALVGNRVYVSLVVAWGPTNALGDGAVMCLDADTGGRVWSAVPKGYRGTFSSPAVEGDSVVVGEGLHKVYDARVICLNAADGKIRWEFRTRSHVESTPCIADGRVYVGAGDDGYYCLDLAGNGDGTTKVDWHVGGKDENGEERPDTPNYRDCECCPAVVDGKFYAGLGNAGQAVICLEAKTGKELWRQSAPYPVFGPPAVVDKKVYIGMGTGDFANKAEDLQRLKREEMQKAGRSDQEIKAEVDKIRRGGEVWCLDANSGKILWQAKIGETILGAIAVREDKVFFGSRDGLLQCYSTDGAKRGQWNAQGAIVTSPAVTGEHVYVTTDKAKLFAVGADDLQPVWEATLGNPSLYYMSSPTVGRGHVYVGADDNGLLCLGQPKEPHPLWSGYLGGPGMGGSISPTMLPARGAFAWAYPVERPEEGAPVDRITAPAASIGQGYLVPVKDGPSKGLVCLSLDKKKNVVQNWAYASPLGVGQSPAAYGDKVFLVEGEQGQVGRKLTCLASADGAVCWSKPLDPQGRGQLLLTASRLYLSDAPESVACLDYQGNQIWQRTVPHLCGSGCLSNDLLLVPVEGSGGIVALSAATGDDRTSQHGWELAGKPVNGPFLDWDMLLLGTEALSPFTGQSLWVSNTAVPATAIVCEKGLISYVSTDGQLVVLSVGGELLGSAPGALSQFPPLVSRDAVLFLTDKAILRFDPAPPAGGDSALAQTPAPTTWMKLDAMTGKASSPMVLIDSQVMFGAERGLVAAKPGR
jgi:outer membrane protein assembly factor BamB